MVTVTKNNPMFRLIAISVLIVIMTIPFIFASPCNAQENSYSDKNEYSHRVRVGIYENKPKVFTNDSGEPSGIFVGILEDIARRENWELEYVTCKWSDCLKLLEDGKIDLMPDVAFSQERDSVLDFHNERVLESWSRVYAHSAKEARNLSDLNGRRIALLKGSIQLATLDQMMKGFGYEVLYTEADSYEEAFTLAANGDVDMVVSNHFWGDYFFEEYGLTKTAIVFNPVSLYFATASGTNRDLLDAIDRNLRLMKSESGSVYYMELERWMDRPPRVVVPQYVFWIIGGIGGSLVLALLLIMVLRKQVRIKTEHLVRANETLRESEEKFRNLFQNHLAVKLIIDPDTGRIVEANEAAEKFYGWSEDELRQKRIHDIDILPAEQIKEQMEKALDDERVHFEFRHRLADNSVRDVEVFCSSIVIDKKTLLHSIVHDITDRKRAEKEQKELQEQLHQARKVEFVGRLASGVAHDYNNMLSVITGYTELALDSMGPSEPLYEDLTEVLNAAKRSTEITQQLLAFARRQTITPKVLNINDVVENMLKMLGRLIGEDINLEWLPDHELWNVKIDPSQVEQILANLCVNARDAIEGVGKVSIETLTSTIDDSYCTDHTGFIPGEFVVLSVSDNGCGMDKKTLDNIFEPFFTTKKVNKGTGMGLATVHGIVKQNDGFINVYSEEGKGTIFRIYLPRHVGEAEKLEPEIVTEIPHGNGELILLVEDESAIRKMSRLMLEKLGYKVLIAETPDMAVSLAEEQTERIDLLITDVVMPGMNGPDLADKMQILHPDLKTLFMSGYTANVIAHKGVVDGDKNFIQKPFTLRELGVKLNEVLAGQRV